MQRIEKSVELTRRALLASAGAAVVFMPERSEAQGLLSFLSGSVFLRRAAIVGLAVGGYLLYEHYYGEQARSEPSASPPMDQQILARRLGGDLALATQIVQLIGKEQTQRVIRGDLGLWAQRDHTGSGLNRLTAHMSNSSEKETPWQLRFAVDDVETNHREFEFKSYGYRIKPYASIDVDTPLKADIPKPGLKKVSVINQPPGISFAAIDVLVVPCEIRQKA
jgi:hypothetical protein